MPNQLIVKQGNKDIKPFRFAALPLLLVWKWNYTTISSSTNCQLKLWSLLKTGFFPCMNWVPSKPEIYACMAGNLVDNGGLEATGRWL